MKTVPSSNLSPSLFIKVGCTLHIASASLGIAETSKQPFGLRTDLPVWSELPNSHLARGQSVES